MGRTKEKLRNGEPVRGGWIMIGHPSVAELMAGEGFDFLGVDLEHTTIGIDGFHRSALAVKGTGVDLLARLPANDPVIAKQVLDAGASGIIVPNVNSIEEARRAVGMARFPPAGFRGASFCRASDLGRDFDRYFARHNDEVLVVVMLEHVDAVKNADAIVATQGIDATLIGPYDLSASMGRPGALDHPDVRAAQQTILEACRRHGVPAGIHVVAVDAAQVEERVRQGFRFLACSIDTEFILAGCRAVLGRGGES